MLNCSGNKKHDFQVISMYLFMHSEVLYFTTFEWIILYSLFLLSVGISITFFDQGQKISSGPLETTSMRKLRGCGDDPQTCEFCLLEINPPKSFFVMVYSGLAYSSFFLNFGKDFKFDSATIESCLIPHVFS